VFRPCYYNNEKASENLATRPPSVVPAITVETFETPSYKKLSSTRLVRLSTSSECLLGWDGVTQRGQRRDVAAVDLRRCVTYLEQHFTCLAKRDKVIGRNNARHGLGDNVAKETFRKSAVVVSDIIIHWIRKFGVAMSEVDGRNPMFHRTESPALSNRT